MRERRTAQDSIGQNVVELSLVLPILLLIFVALIDFGRLYHAYLSATNAARVGAEMATRPDVSNQTVLDAVRLEAAPSVTFTSVSITPTVRASGDAVQIGVSYVFSPFTPLASSFWGGGPLPLAVTAAARVY